MVFQYLNCNVYEFMTTADVQKARLLANSVFHDSGSRVNFSIQTYFCRKTRVCCCFCIFAATKKRSKFLKSEDLGARTTTRLLRAVTWPTAKKSLPSKLRSTYTNQPWSWFGEFFLACIICMLTFYRYSSILGLIFKIALGSFCSKFQFVQLSELTARFQM